MVAVTSTRIYCRPGCPSRLPRRSNVRFYPHAAAAEAAGFRACLRCRPEVVPGHPGSLGTSATVGRALRLIAEGALDGTSLTVFAGRLGVGSRHLTRLFRSHLGVPPGEVARLRRVQFARQLLDDTGLTVAEVAFAAGFGSLRRFNEAVREAFGVPPGELRARGRPLPGGAVLRVRIPYRPPLDFEALLSHFSARAVPGVERVEAGRYLRTVSTADGPAVVEVSRVPGRAALSVRLEPPRPAVLLDVLTRVRRLMDLDADPKAIVARLGPDPLVGGAVRARPGLRVPGAWDSYELLVRAVLGQQVSVAAATRLAGRLAERFGEPLGPLALGGGLTRLFPRADRLASLDPSELPMPRAGAETLVRISAAVVRGELTLLPGASLEATLERLQGYPGIGPWTAEYVALRALREPDAFPAGDLGLRRALGRPGAPVGEVEAARRSEAWRPWRAYAAQHLWTLDAATPRGVRIPPAQGRGTS